MSSLETKFVKNKFQGDDLLLRAFVVLRAAFHRLCRGFTLDAMRHNYKFRGEVSSRKLNHKLQR